MRNSFRFLIASALVCFLAVQTMAQQNVSLVPVSPKAMVVQHIGFAKVKINYSRPGVKGREVYGKLVPYGLAPNAFGNGKPMPWRVGADENTTIYLSNDAEINGNKLTAGIYSIHMIVYEDEWTIIFNTDHDAWGSYFYKEENDALRIKVRPEEEGHLEWLQFGFENLTPSSADVYMHWGKKKVTFDVSFEQHESVLDKYRKELTNLPGFNQAAWANAARYCLRNEVNVEEAMAWVEKALSMNGGNNFNNLSVKAGLLGLQGKNDEGDKLLESSMDLATENELNNYGYQIMNQDRLDDAIKIFKLNIKRHPDSFNVYDSLGEALAKKGDKKGAKENYEIAYDKAPANQKARIEGILKGL